MTINGDKALIQKLELDIISYSKIDTINKIISKEINLSVIKTLAAFANTNGGYLIIGVDEDEYDNPILTGLKPDYTKYKNQDTLKLRFDSLIQTYLGDSFNQHITEFEFVRMRDREVILIKIIPTFSEPVFVKKIDLTSSFFIRRQASTVNLSAEEQYKYCVSRFKPNALA